MAHIVFPDEVTLNQSITKVLKEIRVNLGLSQFEMATKLGLGTDALQKIETNKTKLSLSVLRKYTTVLNITISDIILRAEKLYGIH